jgi:hypothetical protein
LSFLQVRTGKRTARREFWQPPADKADSKASTVPGNPLGSAKSDDQMAYRLFMRVAVSNTYPRRLANLTDSLGMRAIEWLASFLLRVGRVADPAVCNENAVP